MTYPLGHALKGTRVRDQPIISNRRFCGARKGAAAESVGAKCLALTLERAINIKYEYD